jgi:hypothetical protein
MKATASILLIISTCCLLVISSCHTHQKQQPPIVIHDTIATERPVPMMEATLKTLLIQYYKAGWMDASNGVIDLSNAGKFDNRNIERIKKSDWRRMENQINSR